MKKYIAPDMDCIWALSADVITFSENAVGILDEDDWDGKSISDLEFK